MNLLQKIITFGRFSVKRSNQELVVKQKNYLAIFLNLSLLVVFFLIFYFIYQRYGLSRLIPQTPKDYLGLVLVPFVFYLILKNILTLLGAHTFKIDYVSGEIWCDSVRLPLKIIDRFVITKSMSLKSYYYSIAIVFSSSDNDGDETDFEFYEKNLIFLPTKFTKLFLIDIANEANKLLVDKKYFVERKLDTLEIGNIFMYIVFFSIVIYLFFFLIIRILY